MLARMGNWLERSDEDFLKDLYTDAGRRYKIETLRRTRLQAWQRVVGWSVAVAIHALFDAGGAAFLLDRLPLNNALAIVLFLCLTLVALALVAISNLIEFQRIDTQVKILILVAQLKPD